jgi:hypothetical protein
MSFGSSLAKNDTLPIIKGEAIRHGAFVAGMPTFGKRLLGHIAAAFD